MIKIFRFMTVLGLSTVLCEARDDFLRGLYTTSAQLQQSTPLQESTAICALGTNLTLQAVGSIIAPEEEDLLTQLTSHTHTSVDAASLGALVHHLREHLSVGIYVYTDKAEPAHAEAITELVKTGTQNIVVDFKQPSQAAQIINNQVDKDTKGEIKDLVSEDDINDDTCLGLLNTLSIEANWHGEFYEKEMVFKIGKQRRSVQGFVGTEKIRLLETQQAHLIELTTSQNTFSLFIKRPKKRQDPVTPITYREVNRLKEQGTILAQVILPKVEIASTNDLKDQLKLKLPILFRGQNFFTTAFEHPVVVNAFKQKCLVKWDQHGFKGSAATFMGMCYESAPRQPQRIVNVNRPFSFIFALNATHTLPETTVIFSGQVAAFETLSVIK
ncbi:serpin family protein [Candidatus Odyssella thessalonicensis]|uniref:serpin family protein n=1 Tax=Candidatus Odyssella thessalonicensis TaxID=84647 RepID=UPI000225BDB5|nr:serpin family protein [Candidatus Odyssella thessalonicensis]